MKHEYSSMANFWTWAGRFSLDFLYILYSMYTRVCWFLLDFTRSYVCRVWRTFLLEYEIYEGYLYLSMSNRNSLAPPVLLSGPYWPPRVWGLREQTSPPLPTPNIATPIRRDLRFFGTTHPLPSPNNMNLENKWNAVKNLLNPKKLHFLLNFFAEKAESKTTSL